MSNGTLNRVYGGDPGLIHIADGQRAKMADLLAEELNKRMRFGAWYREERTQEQAQTQPLCPGCYMVVGFDMLVTLARNNGQSLTELSRTMIGAFQELAKCEDYDNACRESITVMLDPEPASKRMRYDFDAHIWREQS